MSALAQFAGRHLLFVNWRDVENPAGGGAEAYLDQIATRFARAGAHITLFTSDFPDAAPCSIHRQYLVVREGGRFGVYLAAAHHLRKYAGRYDAIVDFQNGIPFFAPFWAEGRVPVVCVVHHVHQRQFDMYFRWPLNRVGRLLEGRAARSVYRGSPFVAVSPSTRAEMRHQLGIRGAIHVVPNGMEPLPPAGVPRSGTPVIAVVNRLVPHKRIHLLVEALPALLRRWPGLHVDIAGTGPARAGLETLVHTLGLEGAVSLPGRVSEQAKSDLLGRAWLTAAPSLAEGWGLTVLEAATLGTPAVAYNVPGLRDSVCDGETGWLVPPGRGLAVTLMNAIEELSDPARQSLAATRCQRWAHRFSWDDSAERLARVLLTDVRRRGTGMPRRRRPVDLATVATWPPDDTVDVAWVLRQGLRVTDAISKDSNGSVRALLTGCDEIGAAKALQRLRPPLPPAGLRLATTAEILCGEAGDGGW